MAKSIILEGLDGSGKSTQAHLLKEYLESLGKRVVVLREPGGSDYYEAIRKHIHFSELQRSALSDALVCAGGITENVNLTRNALRRGEWVITDRSYISNAVYQVSQGLDWETLENINKIALGGFQYDVKLLLDIPVQQAEKRLESFGGKKDYWESKGHKFFSEVHKNYLKAAKAESMAVLKASGSIKEVQEAIRQLIQL